MYLLDAVQQWTMRSKLITSVIELCSSTNFPSTCAPLNRLGNRSCVPVLLYYISFFTAGGGKLYYSMSSLPLDNKEIKLTPNGVSNGGNGGKGGRGAPVSFYQVQLAAV